MEKLFLEGTKRILLEDNKELVFDYYLVEECRNCQNNVKLYGIKIFQHMRDHLLVEYSEPISDSKEIVEGMIHKLWKNEVTLVTMLEIVDDLVTDCTL
ncbi:hypothetical protein SAMN02745136_04179 [Anaerocolumna jejuensis DSM 15929]|uniref:Uncharacterized protein n=1 Tax=Anaerocolumna jejuensis DSM 15929 TaxID=1121322 RepID=A0A1M6Y6Y4_9FIRM|nr:DUF6514 family protein [Anaerocolumna jejuensis]SHL14044.1 hypothetical protein SAMN02745136_04179 [Anaerocolumna jejuensis DSM 15929]